jgi:iron complex transport system substrate-binding protein
MIGRLFTVVVLLMFYAAVFGFPVDVAEGKENNDQEKYPQRIVSLAPALTESLYLLGIENRLKGCTTYCNKPEQAKHKEKIGTLIDFNLEKILTLKPDLVLGMEFSDRRTIEKLKNLGIRVEIFPSPKNFNHLCESFLRLGQMVGQEEKAQQIVTKAKQDAAFIRQQVAGEKKIKIFWQLGAKPLFAATKGYFTNDYIEFAGGINIAADASSGIYSREEVLKRNPDVIVIVTMGVATETEKQTWKTYQSINAVKNNRIYIVDAYTYCSPTPKGFARALHELVVLLHPSISMSSEEK